MDRQDTAIISFRVSPEEKALFYRLLGSRRVAPTIKALLREHVAQLEAERRELPVAS